MKRWRKALGLSSQDLGMNIMTEIAAYLLLALMFGITIHSAARYLFSISIMWFMEMATYLFLAIVFFALAPVQSAGRHIKVDILTSRLPDRVRRPLLGVFVPIVSLIYVGFFIWGSLLLTWRFYRQGATGYELTWMPMFILTLIIPVGLLVLASVLVVSVLRHIRQVRTGSLDIGAKDSSLRHT